MKQLIQNVRSGALELVDVPRPQLSAGGILVRNVASLISAGTERMVVDFARKSLIGKARERPDLVRQVVRKVRRDGVLPALRAATARLEQPLALGYSCAGVVLEAGTEVAEFAAGDRVACAGMGYASHAELIHVPRSLVVHIPGDVSYEDAAYVALGAIALHGVRTTDPRLGEWVAVIGLGLLGLLTVQMLKASGCRVVAVDLDASRARLAEELGADVAIARSDDVEGAVLTATKGIGVDAAVITAATGSNDPLELAAQLCRDRGRLTVVGAVGMEVPRRSFYQKELELRLSRSYGPGRYDAAYEERGHDYPLAYVRWTEQRNMQEFLRLVETGVVNPHRLTTHRFPLTRAAEAYHLVTGAGDTPYIGIVLEYAGSAVEPPSTVLLRATKATEARVRLGAIGAGNFATTVLLPHLARCADARLVGIATTRGVSARAAGERFEFGYVTTEVARILEDEEIDAVLIATRHGSHASLAARALRAGKSVFVEKPLALDEEGLRAVVDARAAASAVLAVGFNRRFSRLAQRLEAAVRHVRPLAVSYRINAGAVPADSWLHDPAEGGGRIIGEICHFIDFVQFLTGSVCAEVFACAIGNSVARPHDTVAITLGLADGSIASIQYFAVGEPSFSKERIEVFGGGRVGVLDDFRELLLVVDGKRRRWKTFGQDKGHGDQLDRFLHSVKHGGEDPISLSSLIATTRATFAIEESLRTGQRVSVSSVIT